MASTQVASPEVVGFGALNLDYIASASKLSLRASDLVTEFAGRFEWGMESAVDQEVVYEAVGKLGIASLDASLGGSAWNAIYALARMDLKVRLGYVGFAGRVEFPGLSFIKQMDALGIDRRFVGQNAELACGICLSYIEDGERVMLTYPGANLALADYIERNFEAIAAYMATARFIHVTSFLDDHTSRMAFEVLRLVKELSHNTIICFDPGHEWAHNPSPPVEGILRLSDYLLVNYREFKGLGRYSYGDSDEAVAVKLLRRCDANSIVVMPKRYDTIESYKFQGDAITLRRFSQSSANDENAIIEDATGAGDAFAAGLLAALASGRLQVELGAYLGMSLARHKMQHKAFEGHGAFPDLTSGFLQSNDSFQEGSSLPMGVFLAHGTSPQWRVVQRFLEEELRLTVYTLDNAAPNEPAPEVIARHLDSCSVAICILTAEEAMQEGGIRASQSVVHQAGIFQGRYGFGRVAMLVEEGCETFSNVSGLIQLLFPAGDVEATFWHLERMLRREGLLSGH